MDIDIDKSKELKLLSGIYLMRNGLIILDPVIILNGSINNTALQYE